MHGLAVADAGIDQQLVDRDAFHGPYLRRLDAGKVEMIPVAVDLDRHALADQVRAGFDFSYRSACREQYREGEDEQVLHELSSVI